MSDDTLQFLKKTINVRIKRLNNKKERYEEESKDASSERKMKIHVDMMKWEAKINSYESTLELIEDLQNEEPD